MNRFDQPHNRSKPLTRTNRRVPSEPFTLEPCEARLQLAAVFWDGGAGTTSWHDAANWNRGGADMVPQNGDDVTISIAGTPTITFTTGTLTVNSLNSDETLAFNGGTFGVSTTATMNAPLTLGGGTLSGGAWNVASNGLTTIGGINSNRLLNVAITGDILLNVVNARLKIDGSTTFSTLRLSELQAEVGFGPGYTLVNTVSFEGTNTGGRFIGMDAAGTLTVGPTGVIQAAPGFGGSAFIGGQGFAYVAAMTLINQGLIANDTSGRTVTINPVNTASNPGTLRVGSGATLDVRNLAGTGGMLVVNSGTLDLGGTFVTSGLGAMTRTAGTVNITGTWDNSSATFTLDNSTGSWTLAGGTIMGGSLSFTQGQTLLVVGGISSNRLLNVAITGDILLNVVNARLKIDGSTTFSTLRLSELQAEVGFGPGYTLVNTVSFEGTNTGGRFIGMDAAGTLTVGPTGVIQAAPGFGGSAFIGGQGFAYVAAMTLINQGLIANDTSGRTVTINPVNTASNPGTLRVGSGATLDVRNLAGTGGMLVVNSGTLDLGGTFVTSGLGAMTRTAGTVNITGTWDNSSATFTLDNSTGSWTLAGGTIMGGSLSFTQGQTLLVVGGISSNRLLNVAITGDILLNVVNARLKIDGSTTFSTLRLSELQAEVGFGPGYTLVNTVSFEGTNTGGRFIGMDAAGTLTVGPTGVIQAAPGFGGSAFIGGQGFAYVAAMTLINQGLIANDTSGRTVTINPVNTASNPGTLRVGSGATLDVRNLAGTGGMLVVNSGTLDLGGTFVTSGLGAMTRTAGTVNITGTWDNSSATFTLDNSTGSWTLAGGTIMGGSLSFTQGQTLLVVGGISSNRLLNVAITGDILLNVVNARLKIDGSTTFSTLRLSELQAEVGFGPGYTLVNTVSFEGTNTGGRFIGMDAAGTLTVGPTGVIQAAPGFGGSAFIGGQGFAYVAAMTLINQGLISSAVSGRTINVIPTAGVTNTGTLQAISGGLVATNMSLNNGTVLARSGGGITITPTGGTITNSGLFVIGRGNIVTVTGNFTQQSGGTLEVEIGGLAPTDIGRIAISGAATLGGTVRVTPVNGWQPECVNNQIISAASVAGQFATQQLPSPPAGHQSLIVYTGTEVRFAISPQSDFNRDGVLNSQDVFDFLTAFFNNNADFNGDGFTNSQDFFDFLASFFQGC